MNIAVITDDRGMANVLSYYFNEIRCSILSRSELNNANLSNCTHIILGVNKFEKDDWDYLYDTIHLGVETVKG